MVKFNIDLKNMAKIFTALVLLANTRMSKCHEDYLEEPNQPSLGQESTSYSFSYGVSDARTGDIKTVWESKEGDTVKGHYSVLEPDGSVRTVEYSAGPKTRFTAVVNTENTPQQEQVDSISQVEEKSHRDYENFYDFSEDADEELYMPKKRKRIKPSTESSFNDYSPKKRPNYAIDLEPSDYTHSITIKHPYDQSTAEGEPESHIGFNYDPDCKTNKHGNNDLYTNVAELDLGAKKFYPTFTKTKYHNIDNYHESPSYDIEKYTDPFALPDFYKKPKYPEHVKTPVNKIKGRLPLELENYPFSQNSPEKFFDPEYIPSKPKKKNKPRRKPESYYYNDDPEDFVLVPKKKYKIPIRNADHHDDYKPDFDDEYNDRLQYSNTFEDDERPHRERRPSRPTGQREVIKKIIKKRNPVIKLLDILDI